MAAIYPSWARRRRGAAIVYIALMMIVLMGIISLSVDLGHVQVVKSELQIAAEAAARAGANNLTSGTTAAKSAAVAAAAANNVDGTAVSVSSTNDVFVGNYSNGTFTSGGSPTNAIQVYARRIAANNNAISLTFGSIIGRSTCNVTASAIATVTTTTVNVTVQATSNIYFAGMPNGTTNYWGDTTASQGATQTSINVVPGTYLTFSTFTGTTSVVDGTVPYVGPAGLTTAPGNAIQHGESYDGTWSSPTGAAYSENGIANAIMPDSSLIGLFLNNNAPTSSSAPATVDWTTSAQQNQTSYTNIQLQQPFMIGDGKTSGSTVQQFMVPAGATRFYMGIWDGAEYNNNGGSLSGTVTSKVTQIVN